MKTIELFHEFRAMQLKKLKSEHVEYVDELNNFMEILREYYFKMLSKQ